MNGSEHCHKECEQEAKEHTLSDIISSLQGISDLAAGSQLVIHGKPMKRTSIDDDGIQAIKIHLLRASSMDGASDTYQ